MVIFKFNFFAKNAQKKYFCVSGHYGNLKTYLDTKFQLIWPSNKARTSKWAWRGQKKITFEKKMPVLMPWLRLKAKWAETWCQDRFSNYRNDQKRKNIFFAHFCAFLAKKLNLKTTHFFQWLYRHLKSDHTPHDG